MFGAGLRGRLPRKSSQQLPAPAKALFQVFLREPKAPFRGGRLIQFVRLQHNPASPLLEPPRGRCLEKTSKLFWENKLKRFVVSARGPLSANGPPDAAGARPRAKKKARSAAPRFAPPHNDLFLTAPLWLFAPGRGGTVTQKKPGAWRRGQASGFCGAPAGGRFWACHAAKFKAQWACRAGKGQRPKERPCSLTAQSRGSAIR
jgi:hypothetical protein